MQFAARGNNAYVGRAVTACLVMEYLVANLSKELEFMKKIALITGASRGIGAATARHFAQQGYTVIINYNNSADKAKALQTELLQCGYDVHLYKADVSSEQQAKEMFEYVAKYFKHLDVLINNAGVWRGGLVQDVSLDDYNTVMDTNARGAFLCCRHAMPLLLKGENPSVVNVSSIWGLYGASCESIYSMSKHAVIGLTASLAKEWKASGIRVNCLCPPMVQTDMCAGYSQLEIDDFCKQTGTNVYTADQVAKHIYQLAIDNNSGIVKELK